MPVFRDIDFEHPSRQIRLGVFAENDDPTTYGAFGDWLKKLWAKFKQPGEQGSCCRDPLAMATNAGCADPNQRYFYPIMDSVGRALTDCRPECCDVAMGGLGGPIIDGAPTPPTD